MAFGAVPRNLLFSDMMNIHQSFLIDEITYDHMKRGSIMSDSRSVIRGLVATRNISPGELLFSEPAILQFSSDSEQPPTSDYVNRRISEYISENSRKCGVDSFQYMCQLFSSEYMSQHVGMPDGVGVSAASLLNIPLDQNTAQNYDSPYAFGLFVQSSLIRHSCGPNVEVCVTPSVTGEGPATVSVFASRRIVKDSEITRSWFPYSKADFQIVNDTFEVRQRWFMEHLFRKCNCHLCETFETLLADGATLNMEDHERVQLKESLQSLDDFTELDKKCGSLLSIVSSIEQQYANGFCDFQLLIRCYLQAASYIKVSI